MSAAGLERFARLRLLDRPTPLEPLARIGAETGHPALWVKRDDAMPLGLGGNKLRSLEFWAGAARAQGADALVVAGPPDSNQCRLTAAVAAKLGLDCLILCNADPPARAGGNLLLSLLFGAGIEFLGPVSEAARGTAARQRVEDMRRAGRRPYLVGDPVLGALGYVAGAAELLAQAGAAGVAFRHLVIPGSMGPTEAGFLYGLLAGGFAGTVHVISVEYPAAELEARIGQIFAGLEGLLGELHTGPAAIARYDGGFLAPGYGRAGPAARDAIRRFARSEALLLEPTYTAKPFAALLSMVESGMIGPAEPACALHTGGLPSLFVPDALRGIAPGQG